MPMSQPLFAAVINNAIARATNDLKDAEIAVQQAMVSVEWPENSDPNELVSLNAELVVRRARAAGLKAELAALGAVP
jgi:hypothetical protein